jgi:hypothetical protein
MLVPAKSIMERNTKVLVGGDFFNNSTIYLNTGAIQPFILL